MKQPVTVGTIQLGDGIPKICVPIVEHTYDSILAAAKNALASYPDIIEWRCDHFDQAEDPEAAKHVLQGLHEVLGSIPVLFTFRSKKEGGEKEISPASYQHLNCQVAQSGLADLVDVEIFTGDDVVRTILDTAHSAGVPVVASSHNFQSTPAQEEILSILGKMDQMGADVLKIAVMPQSRKDVLTLLSATEEMDRRTTRPLITMSMGPVGMISRLCGEVFGSALTFGSVGKASAPGQVNANDLAGVLKLIHESMGN
ncbi:MULTISPECIES: type I 3-dehydroquinate dehydratase [unclassified Clostridium]|uniref:type I 3-dehydroquinate dehydratase n=1 Tax=unclassified Clostridium TaxID=2614128 RepID=UPI000E521E8E|nr:MULTISPECIES: type I 3-dehydroquinate dehydratase [unclassified Clostridium]RHP47997.1 type I 3-dehydroquinate dehydratase [Clostridium sp. AF32-12BH]RHV64860.1 type I 3-dehydroquinate dehydratase [Clostridium sp. OM02-18AC]